MRHSVVVFFVIAVAAVLLGFGDVRNVSGVGRLMNVVSNAKQPQDDEIERTMKNVFETHAGLRDIGIEVTNCVARLKGTVSSDSERREAMRVAIERLETMQVARAAQAVCFVQDELRLAH